MEAPSTDPRELHAVGEDASPVEAATAALGFLRAAILTMAPDGEISALQEAENCGVPTWVADTLRILAARAAAVDESRQAFWDLKCWASCKCAMAPPRYTPVLPIIADTKTIIGDAVVAFTTWFAEIEADARAMDEAAREMAADRAVVSGDRYVVTATAPPASIGLLLIKGNVG